MNKQEHETIEATRRFTRANLAAENLLHAISRVRQEAYYFIGSPQDEKSKTMRATLQDAEKLAGKLMDDTGSIACREYIQANIIKVEL